MKYALLTFLVLAIVALIGYDDFFWKRRWRSCLRCKHWFSDCGDILTDLPAGTPENRIDGLGVCSDCSADIEFNRE